MVRNNWFCWSLRFLFDMSGRLCKSHATFIHVFLNQNTSRVIIYYCAQFHDSRSGFQEFFTGQWVCLRHGRCIIELQCIILWRFCSLYFDNNLHPVVIYLSQCCCYVQILQTSFSKTSRPTCNGVKTGITVNANLHLAFDILPYY